MYLYYVGTYVPSTIDYSVTCTCNDVFILFRNLCTLYYWLLSNMYMYFYYLGTYVPSTVDFPITNGDKGFGFSNPYEGNYFFQ